MRNFPQSKFQNSYLFFQTQEKNQCSDLKSEEFYSLLITYILENHPILSWLFFFFRIFEAGNGRCTLWPRLSLGQLFPHTKIESRV